MREINTLGWALIVFIIIIMLRMYWESDAYNLKCIISNVDSKTYCVRERKQMKNVANLLARTTQKLQKLVIYVNKKYSDQKRVQRLVKRFNPQRISEVLPTSEYTAYSENKGEKLALCVTKSKKGNDLINENLLTFVAIHELSHIMSKKIGHGDEFWQNFKFLLENASELGVYQPEDYKKNNVTYCGMQITDNPYYDLK